MPFGKGIYGSEIYRELNEKGAQVWIYDERPSLEIFHRFAFRFGKKITKRLFEKYIIRIMELIEVADIDYILVIRGELFDSSILALLRRNYPQAKMVLYLWDSINYTDTSKILDSFDEVHTFDLRDSLKYNLRFRPLFFLQDYENVSNLNILRDVVFVGKIHSDRMNLLKNIKKQLEANHLTFLYYMYLQGPEIYYFYKCLKTSFWSATKNDFIYKMLPAKGVAELIGTSFASLDFQHPSQSGLTMRTIEVLGARRKLITTNENIKDYDFYEPNNILIINRKKIEINKDFIECPFKEIPVSIYHKYSLSGWLTEVFNL